MKKLFYVVAAAFALSACSLGLVPFAICKDGNLNLLGYVSGALFWSGLVIGMIGYIFLCGKLKSQIQAELLKEKIPSVFRFFSNRMAQIADTILIVALLGMVITGMISSIPVYVSIVCIVLLLLGIYGHFLFNGKVYQYIQISKNMS